MFLQGRGEFLGIVDEKEARKKHFQMSISELFPSLYFFQVA